MTNNIQKVLVLDSYGDAHVATIKGFDRYVDGYVEVAIWVKLPQYPEKKPTELHQKHSPPKPWFATVVFPSAHVDLYTGKPAEPTIK